MSKLNTILLLLLSAVEMTAKGQYVSHSVLSEGTWVKMAIAEEGMYAVKGGELPSGIVGCATGAIALYGQAGGELSVVNGSWRPDDLEEIPIEVADKNGNGVFDSQDEIVFYATGADKWNYNESQDRFTHKTHPYSTYNYVFLTSKAGTHKRIETATTATTDGSDVTSGRMLRWHEKELTNTHRTGQVWVGEHFFGSNTEQTIVVPLSGAVTGRVRLRYALASVSTASSRFSVTIGGTTKNIDFSERTRYREVSEEVEMTGATSVTVTIRYSYSESMASGYLDYIEVDATGGLYATGSQCMMDVPPDGTSYRKHVMSASSGMRVLDVTDPTATVEMSTATEGGKLTFVSQTDKWRRYIAFDGTAMKKPTQIETIGNQDIHGGENAELVIVTNARLKNQAERLASLHSIHDGMRVTVVTEEEVFNEFSSGQRDPLAIREMMRMMMKRYNAGNESVKPQHLLLFGKATYDNRDILNYGMPTVVTYQSPTSFDDDGLSYTTDDVLTYLDDGEGVDAGMSMDISVGRMPAKSVEEAENLVNKIERYMTRSDLTKEGIRGDWRNYVALLADDADPSNGGDTVFTTSSEITAQQISAKYPHITIDKIYADAYVQQSGADGSYYPDVNNALKKRMDYGCLLLNYIGHGSAQYIGTERFMMKSNISGYRNYDQLPFFITSTCTFGQHDNPETTCGGEEFVLAEGGGIACLAATRPISHVQAVNTDMVMQALNPENTIGDAIRIAKNHRTTTQALALIGDPALRLSVPTHEVVVTAVNGHATANGVNDTALTLSTVTIEGEVRDASGELVSDFEGDVYPEVYDRERRSQTLANDNEGCEVSYTVQNSLLYKGHTMARGGKFSYSFIVPRDVAFQFEKSRITHYAKSGGEDAAGAYTRLYVGGFDETVTITESRPEIKLYMNDTAFVNGGICDENPTMLAYLYDSLGINAVGSGLGHDLTATLDGNSGDVIVLNDFYETDISDEHRGVVTYTLGPLKSGRHTIELKAWNIFNFSSKATLTFYVRPADTLSTKFVAYPNPATERATLTMEHNMKGKIASAVLDIYDIQGRKIKSLTPAVNSESYNVGPVEWALDDDGGRRVKQGIYVARFTVTTEEGERMTEAGKVAVR